MGEYCCLHLRATRGASCALSFGGVGDESNRYVDNHGHHNWLDQLVRKGGSSRLGATPGGRERVDADSDIEYEGGLRGSH